jgi:CheY-like chemotaxis protein
MRRILVIEDEEALRDDLVDLLRSAPEGYEVLEAPEGRTGLALIEARRPDLVICDRLMPAMAGHEVLEALRARDPEFAGMSFVFLTALTDVRDREAVAALNPTLYLSKPIDHGALLRAIAALLEPAPRSP